VDVSLWQQLIRGVGCPFDTPGRAPPNDYEIVGTLSSSTLYLCSNQTYRGHCVLVLDLRHATRPDELSKQEWISFCGDLHTAESAIAQTLSPDHINVAALGNLVPHLHWHIVPRYRTDPRWGGPIWSANPADMPETRLPDHERSSLVKAIRAALPTAPR
jgi:diadenosine tetraphosphate (Ap4A) HIT family hydrolase